MRRPVLTAAVFAAAFSTILTTPGCSLVGFVQFGVLQVRMSSLREGDPAPDVRLVTIDGEPTRLLDHLTNRPLVLVFGSFT